VTWSNFLCRPSADLRQRQLPRGERSVSARGARALRSLRNLWLLLAMSGCSSGPLQPTTIDFQPLRQGVTAGPRTTTDFVVARTQSEWESAWRLPISDQAYWVGAPKPPVVEFSKNMVLGIVLPSWPNGCTKVTITSVRKIDGHLNVEYSGYHHRADEVCIASLRAPYVFVTVPFANGDVRFVEIPPE